MTSKTCKHYVKNGNRCKNQCNIPHSGSCCVFASYYYEDQDFTTVASILCKFYEEKKEEKYALFFNECYYYLKDLNLNKIYGSTYIDKLDYEKVSYEKQLTSPMPLEELTAKCSSLLDDPVWKEHVKIKRVDDK